MSEYKYPAEAVFHQEEIKKSTFIVHIGHTPDLNAAKAFIKNIEEKYSDALMTESPMAPPVNPCSMC